MSPEPEVVGYIVHIGSEPGVYTKRVDVGNTTTYVLTTAVSGQQYCFAVSAYVAGPVEGARSLASQEPGCHRVVGVLQLDHEGGVQLGEPGDDLLERDRRAQGEVVDERQAQH